MYRRVEFSFRGEEIPIYLEEFIRVEGYSMRHAHKDFPYYNISEIRGNIIDTDPDIIELFHLDYRFELTITVEHFSPYKFISV